MGFKYSWRVTTYCILIYIYIYIYILYLTPACGKTASLKHTLTGCQYALRNNIWRYNEVLEIFAEASKIRCETANKALNNIINGSIHFIKEVNSLKLSHKNMYRSLFFDGCTNCHVATDLEHHFVFPTEIALMTQHPDVIY